MSEELVGKFSLNLSMAEESNSEYLSGNILIETSPINFTIHMVSSSRYNF